MPGPSESVRRSLARSVGLSLSPRPARPFSHPIQAHARLPGPSVRCLARSLARSLVRSRRYVDQSVDLTNSDRSCGHTLSRPVTRPVSLPVCRVEGPRSPPPSLAAFLAPLHSVWRPMDGRLTTLQHMMRSGSGCPLSPPGAAAGSAFDRCGVWGTGRFWSLWAVIAAMPSGPRYVDQSDDQPVLSNL